MSSRLLHKKAPRKELLSEDQWVNHCCKVRNQSETV